MKTFRKISIWFSGCTIWLSLAILPYAAVPGLAADVGSADVLSAVYVQKKQSGCYSLHTGEDYIYLSPNNTGGAWRQVTMGYNLVDKYKVLTGDTIRVTYKNASSTSRRLLSDPPPELESIDVVSETEGHEIFTGTQIRINSTIYIIRTCGWNASATVGEMNNLYFSPNNSISRYHNICTYGKVAYDPLENFVFNVTVDVPCSGTVQNGALSYPYDASTKCGAAEQFAWRQYAEAAALAAGFGQYMNVSRRRLVFILPNEVKCPWAGLGSVGCGGSTCTVYIKGAYAKSLTVNMHELSHTQGLSHAGQGFDEYGDFTDVMGTAKSEGYLCFNVGNQFRVGWNKPLATLLPANTSAVGNGNATGTWVIPASSSSDINALYLLYNAPGTPFPNYFVSFRVRTSTYDNVLPSTNNRRVYVHDFNGTASDRDYNRTLLVASLGVNGTFTSPFVDRNNDENVGGGVKITVVSISATSAKVRLCRFTQLVESGAGCNDGIDNDCDGLVDDLDPSCTLPPPPPGPVTPARR